MDRIKELNEKRVALHEANAALMQKAQEEKRELTAEESQEWDRRDAEFEKLTAQIAKLHKQEDQRKELESFAEGSTGRAAAGGAADSLVDSEERAIEDRTLPADPAERAEVIQQRDNAELRNVLLSYWRNEPILARFTDEQRSRLNRRRVRRYMNELRSQGLPEESIREVELRALSHVTNTAGEYLIPESWFNRVIVALKAFGGMRRSRATVLRTTTGEQMHLPTVDDTSNTGRQLAENTEVEETDVVLAEKVLDAYLYHSDLVRFPIQLAQDAAYDVGGLLARLLAERLGRKTNNAYTVGTGTNQPQGIVGASALGKTAVSPTAITYLEMLDLKYSLDPDYQDGVGEWMFNNSTKKAIKQLLDGQSRPLFQPDVQSGRIDRIDGDPFIVNQDMASIATGTKPMLYGDFSYFFIRDVLDTQMVTLRERFAEKLQVGLMAYLRTDSEEADAGQNPVKHYIMA